MSVASFRYLGDIPKVIICEKTTLKMHRWFIRRQLVMMRLSPNVFVFQIQVAI